jgi:hypothetical protein
MDQDCPVKFTEEMLFYPVGMRPDGSAFELGCLAEFYIKGKIKAAAF